MSVRSSILAVAAVAAGLATVSLGAAPAVAGELEAVEVQYQDLNLAHASGQEPLNWGKRMWADVQSDTPSP